MQWATIQSYISYCIQGDVMEPLLSESRLLSDLHSFSNYIGSPYDIHQTMDYLANEATNYTAYPQSLCQHNFSHLHGIPWPVPVYNFFLLYIDST